MSKMSKNLDYYLALPWTFTVEKIIDDGEAYYLARVVELNGCMSDGESPVAAIVNLQDALKGCIEGELSVGNEIPEPMNAAEYKGYISYRTKPEKHYKLAKEAQRRGISVNRLIDEAVTHVLAS